MVGFQWSSLYPVRVFSLKFISQQNVQIFGTLEYIWKDSIFSMFSKVVTKNQLRGDI